MQVYIKCDGVTYTNETVLYYYKTYSSVSSIYPIYGPTQGGTLVNVVGVDFDDQAYCYINNFRIKPIRVNSTLIICETIKHKAANNLSFELTFNDNNYITNTGLTFSYYNDIQINTILPDYLSIDAGRNKVLLDIYGLGFMNTSELSVRVVNNIIKPIFISNTHL